MSGRSDYENWLSEAIGSWPIAKGSLTEVRKTCGKSGCRRCAGGEKHPAWLFMYRLDGKACSMHVPKQLVPLIETAIENGHRLERQLVESGIALIRNRLKDRHKNKITFSTARLPLLLA